MREVLRDAFPWFKELDMDIAWYEEVNLEIIRFISATTYVQRMVLFIDFSPNIEEL